MKISILYNANYTYCTNTLHTVNIYKHNTHTTMSQQPKNIKLDARLQRRLKRAEIREKILNKQAKKNKKAEKWEGLRQTNEKISKDYCEKATHEMQQAEDVKKVIEHCYQNIPGLVDIKLLNHHLKEKNLVIMSLQEVKEHEEKKKEIEIYRSNIWNTYNMIKRDLHNFDAITPLVKTVLDHLKQVHKILGCTIWPNPIPQHMFQTDV